LALKAKAMSTPLPTVREVERTLQASGLTRAHARRAIHFLKVAGYLEVLAPMEKPQRGIFNKLKNALLGK